MSLRDVLAHFPIARRLVRATELDSTEPKHRATLQKADRAISAVESYRAADAVLKLHVRRR